MRTKDYRTARIEVRLTPEEKEDLCQKAAELDTTPSALVRAFASFPMEVAQEAIEGRYKREDGKYRVLVFDRETYPKLIYQLRKWGFHYDGCLRALNTIAAGRLARKDIPEYMDEAMDNLRKIDVAKDQLIEHVSMLLLLPSVQLDEPRLEKDNR